MTIECESCRSEIKSAPCSCCEEPAPLWAKFCPHCGSAIKREVLKNEKDSLAAGSRRACYDGNCIGILDAGGRCTICGRAS